MVAYTVVTEIQKNKEREREREGERQGGRERGERAIGNEALIICLQFHYRDLGIVLNFEKEGATEYGGRVHQRKISFRDCLFLFFW